MGLKPAGLDRKAGLSEKLDGAPEQVLGLLRRGGIDEAGATALSRVSVEGELADNQKLGPYVQGRAIELAVFVVEDAEVGCLVDYVEGLFLSVSTRETYQHYQARSDCANDVGSDGDRGLRNPLYQGSQLSRPSYFFTADSFFGFSLESDLPFLEDSALGFDLDSDSDSPESFESEVEPVAPPRLP